MKILSFLFALACVLLANAVSTPAQNKDAKFDVGFVFSALRQADDAYQLIPENELVPRIRHNFGYGGRFTYNLFKDLGLEAEVNYFPKSRSLNIAGPFSTSTGFPVGG